MIATLLLALSPALAATQAPDYRQTLDLAVHWLRWEGRNPDGSYGKGVEDTALALLAFARSPRRYTVQDGPWIREAAQWLLSKNAGDVRVREALAAVGVEVDPTAVPARVEEISPEAAGREADALARRFSPEGHVSESVRETALAAIRLSTLLDRLPRTTPAGGPPPETETASSVPAASLDEALQRAGHFLRSQEIEPGRWGFAGRPDAGITALAAAALAALPGDPGKAHRASLDRALEWLASIQDQSGAITEGGLAAYVTSVAILAFHSSGDPRYRPTIEKARRFLTAVQCDEGEGYTTDDNFYGGIGYGNDERPDLSNLNLAIDALRAADLPKDDPAVARMLRFLDRCQNRSESNPTVVSAEGHRVLAGNDGGGIYYPGNSPAGYVDLPDGTRVARSYGSMTYSLLKGYVFAGLPTEDPRVQAALGWIRKNWTLEENPGFDRTKDPRAGHQGYYYYLYTLARTLHSLGEPTVEDAAGKPHDWRAELAARLLALQRADGSWVNEVDRWWEGHPVIPTSYATLALTLGRS